MRDYHVNKEAWHESWLRNYVGMSRQYLAREYGDGETAALIVRLTDGDVRGEAIYHVKGEVMMPRGGGFLCALMAPYTLAPDLINAPDRIVGSEMNDFPPETFFLEALLEAAYPYKIDGSGFKAHAELMIEYENLSQMTEEGARHMAFFGYGFLLMNKVRQLIDPLASPERIASRCCESYLCVMERDK